MPDATLLPPAKAKLCRLAGAVFLLSALAMPFVIVTAGVTPGASPYCDTGDGCVWKAQPGVLLAEETRIEVAASPVTQRRFDAYAARGDVRIGLALIDAVDTVPFALLILSVGLALRRLGGAGRDALPQALRWLRRAAIAAIAWSLAQPVYESLLETLLSPGTPDGAMIVLSIGFGMIGTALLLAFAAYAAVWALEAAVRAQRDLAEFI
ncbi:MULTISPECIES: hypothetical protein [unclassified Sphingomonas]|uniref:hypothetical protein n=1 Tax=unclassified Sphingomonas TaxID=196159 RepID=UPI000B2A81B8|nr:MULTISPECIES: hypothetical protein [unclassified Sphingomonas]